MEKSIAVTLDSANDSFQSMGANVLLNIILEIYLKRVFLKKKIAKAIQWFILSTYLSLKLFALLLVESNIPALYSNNLYMHNYSVSLHGCSVSK